MGRKIRVVSDGTGPGTRVLDAETGEDLADRYGITDVELYFRDATLCARLEVFGVEADAIARVEEVS